MQHPYGQGHGQVPQLLQANIHGYNQPQATTYSHAQFVNTGTGGVPHTGPQAAHMGHQPAQPVMANPVMANPGALGNPGQMFDTQQPVYPPSQPTDAVEPQPSQHGISNTSNVTSDFQQVTVSPTGSTRSHHSARPKSASPSRDSNSTHSHPVEPPQSGAESPTDGVNDQAQKLKRYQENQRSQRKKLVSAVSTVLEQLCRRNDQQRHRDISNGSTCTMTLTRFHAATPPPITVLEYIQRIAKYSDCSNEVLILAMIYIDRVILANTNFLPNSFTVHRIVVASITIAAKFFDDRYYSNRYYAQIGGLPVAELNTLEIELLYMLAFNLFVSESHFKTYKSSLLG